jgi:uncharacterized protein
MSCKITNIVKQSELLLDKLFTEVKMPASHGLQHCLTVLGHMNKAIECNKDSETSKLSETRKLSLCLAALLHEADDHKYFKEGSSNAANIMSKVFKDQTDFTDSSNIESEVLEMISYVSASVNGNTVPEKAKSDPSLLWPRLCDRLEAIGVIGAVRCYQYNKEVEAPLFTDTTPRPKTTDEVWSFVTEERWQGYQNGGNSASMMDHYYDKLLQIAVFQPHVVNNSYLVDEASKRVQPLLDICVEFGKTGVVPEDLIKSYQTQG